MRDNQDTSVDLIQARQKLGRSQATLNIELGLTTSNASINSSGGTVSGGVVGGTLAPEAGGGSGGGGIGCPTLRQFVLVQGTTGTAIPTLVKYVEVGMFLWNPMLHTFEEIIVAKIIENTDLWKISDGVINAVGSASHPLIHNINDNVGTPLSKCEIGVAALVLDGGLRQSTLTKLEFCGKGEVKRLETAGPSHIYAAGNKPEQMFVFHNAKPVSGGES